MLLVALLQTARLLLLPLLEVPHRLHGGLLPGRGARVVVDVVDASSRVSSPLPAERRVMNVKLYSVSIRYSAHKHNHDKIKRC